MRIIAADSGAAILNGRFESLQVVAQVTILREPPHSIGSFIPAEPTLTEAEKGYHMIVH